MPFPLDADKELYDYLLAQRTVDPTNPPRPRAALLDPTSPAGLEQWKEAHQASVSPEVDNLVDSVAAEQVPAPEVEEPVSPEVHALVDNVKAEVAPPAPDRNELLLKRALGLDIPSERLQGARAKLNEDQFRLNLSKAGNKIGAALARTKVDNSALDDMLKQAQTPVQNAEADDAKLFQLRLAGAKPAAGKGPMSKAEFVALYKTELDNDPELKAVVAASDSNKDFRPFSESVERRNTGKRGDRSLDQKDRQFTLQESQAAAKNASTSFRDSLARDDSQFNRAKVAGEALTKYQDDIKDYRDLDADLRSFYDMAKKIDPEAAPGVLDAVIRKYGKGLDTRINAALGDNEKSAIQAAFGRLMNAYVKKQFGAALSANEASRADAAMNAGLLGSWAAKLEAIDLMRKAQGKALSGIQAAYADLVPDSQWQAFVGRGGIAPLQDSFYGGGPTAQAPGLPAITTPPPNPVQRLQQYLTPEGGLDPDKKKRLEELRAKRAAGEL